MLEVRAPPVPAAGAGASQPPGPPCACVSQWKGVSESRHRLAFNSGPEHGTRAMAGNQRDRLKPTEHRLPSPEAGSNYKPGRSGKPFRTHTTPSFTSHQFVSSHRHTLMSTVRCLEVKTFGKNRDAAGSAAGGRGAAERRAFLRAERRHRGTPTAPRPAPGSPPSRHDGALRFALQPRGDFCEQSGTAGGAGTAQRSAAGLGTGRGGAAPLGAGRASGALRIGRSRLPGQRELPRPATSRSRRPCPCPGPRRQRADAASPRRAPGPPLLRPGPTHPRTPRRAAPGCRPAARAGPASPRARGPPASRLARRPPHRYRHRRPRAPPVPPRRCPHWPAPRPAPTPPPPIGQPAASTGELAAADWRRRRAAGFPASLGRHFC